MPIVVVPIVVVHGLDHARAALAAAEAEGVRIRLESADGAAGQGGALWFLKVIEAAHDAHPGARFEAVLDCGEAAGRALGAIREYGERHRDEGTVVPGIRSRAPRAVRAKLAAMARAAGIAFHEGARGRALDLHGLPNPEAAAREWLARGKAQAKAQAKVRRNRTQNGPRRARPRRLQKT